MRKPEFLFAVGASLALIVSLTTQSQAQPSPRVKLLRVMPLGAKAGTSVEVTVEGTNLDDLRTLYFSLPGIQAERLPDPEPKVDPKAKKPTTPPVLPIRFKVTVPVGTPIGSCDIRAVGKHGISNPRAFAIGDLTEFVEAEPNNDVGQAQKIELNSTVNGTIAAKIDVDYYRFDGKKGQRVVVHCAGWSMDSKLSPMVQMFDDQDRQVITKYRMSDDLVADAILPRDATYVVRVCEFAYQFGGADSFYRLTVSDAPWLDSVFPPVVEAGTTSAVQVFGRNLPNGKPGLKSMYNRPLDTATVQVTARVQPTDTLAFRGLLLPKTLGLEGAELRMKNMLGTSNPLLMTYCHQPVILEKEPNDTPDAAQVLPIPAEVCGRILTRNDRDWYSFDAKKGEAIVLECFADRLGSPMDMSMQISRAEPLQFIGEYDDHADLPTMVGQFWTRTEDPKTRFLPPADGKYLVMVTSRTAAMRAGPRFVYRLSVHRARPDFHVVLIDNQDGNSGGFTLERGGHQDFRVLCLREDGFHDEVRLEAEGLPKGVSCAPQVLGPDVSESVLVLRADDNAPLDFGAFHVKASAVVDGRKVVRAVQTGTLIWPNAQKAAPAHSRLTRSLCVAVCEPGPFVIDAPQREFAVAAGTTLEVKVRTTRTSDDFKAPVALSRLGGPVAPGGKAIAVPNVTIAANQTEAVVKIALPANTLPGDYSLVFQGKGKLSYQPNPKDKKKITFDFTTASPPITVTVFNTVVDLTLAQPGIALKPGANGSVAVKVKRLHKYDGPIQIELVPQAGTQGITAVPLTLAAGKNDGELLVQAPKNAKVGVYPNFVIRASAKLNGVVLKQETKLQVSVNNMVSADGASFEVKTAPLLAESSAGWRYLPSKKIADKQWSSLTFNDSSWKTATTPVGYGEPDVAVRKGTALVEKGEAICFRREVIVPEAFFKEKGAAFRLQVASDDNATVFLNGQVVDKDDADHEFTYWNRDVVLSAKLMRPGRNVVAVLVNNATGSSDCYFDLAIQTQTPVTKAPVKK